MWNHTLFSLFVVTLALAVGDIISRKTKGLVIGLLFVCPLYIVGYLTGIIPQSSPADTGLVAMMGSFGMLVVITNLGTIIELEQLLREWKTVAVCLAGIAATALLFVVLGIPLFGHALALSAIAPSFGGTMAALIVGEAATAAGAPEIAAFAVLMMTLRTFIGIPAASVCLKRYCRAAAGNAQLLSASAASDSGKRFNIRLLPPMKPEYDGTYMKLAKLLLTALAARCPWRWWRCCSECCCTSSAFWRRIHWTRPA